MRRLYRERIFDPRFYLLLTLLLVLLVTLTPNPAGNGKPNRIPLRNTGGPVDLLGNVGLFLPFGVLTSMTLKQKAHPTWARVLLVLGAGLLFSASIETTQLWLSTRSADIDDVIFNSCGALLGAML